MNDISQLRTPPRITELPLAREKEAFPQREKSLWRFTIDGDEFDFVEGKLRYNGRDLAQVIKQRPRGQSSDFWTMLTRHLATYRDWAQLNVNQPQALAAFLALMQGYLTQLYHRIKKRFDETLEGIGFLLEDGELWINGVNVHTCLAMARDCRKQQKNLRQVKIFLKGLRGRLYILQANRMGNPNYEKIRPTVESLIAQLGEEIELILDAIALPEPSLSLGSA